MTFSFWGQVNFLPELAQDWQGKAQKELPGSIAHGHRRHYNGLRSGRQRSHWRKWPNRKHA
jgi:hypothetical protein